MISQIFINLPIKNLKKSVDFFTKLGFKFNPQFTDDTSTCMIMGENIFTMLLEEEKFKEFTPKNISDAKKNTEVLIALPFENRKGVDEIISKAIKSGGREPRKVQDLGFMYSRAFEDLDGHIWEVFHMNMEEFPKN